MLRTILFVPSLLIVAMLAGCSTSGQSVSTYGSVTKLDVCSGYGCVIKEHFTISEAERAEIAAMFAGVETAEQERAIVSKAIGRMEQIARKHLRYRRDKKYADFGGSGIRGEMDCVDESLNTTGYLYYLYGQKIIKFHKPTRNYAERGLLIDGRYPHKSAIMKDTNGTWWAVDSWKEDGGSPAQIILLSDWRKERASDYRS